MSMSRRHVTGVWLVVNTCLYMLFVATTGLRRCYLVFFYYQYLVHCNIMPAKKKFKSNAPVEEPPVGQEDIPKEEEDFKPTTRSRGRAAKKAASAGMKRSHDSIDGDDSEPVSVKKTASSQEEKPKSKGRKKPASSSQSTESDKKPSLKKANSNNTDELDFTSLAVTKDKRPWTLKFSSWNVNGIRAWLKNNGFEYVKKELPDIFCLQETKCDENELPHNDLKLEGYKSYWSSAEQKGYSGTGLYTKNEPINVSYGIGIDEHDKEGRVITAEFEKFYFVTSYVPNAGDKLKRIKYRVDGWDPAFRQYLKTLDDKKPVVLCGDLNVAHHEIDLANPKSNSKTSGFTKEERESFSTLLEENKFVDSFRHLYPEKKDAYSYWSYRSNSRQNNKGWRLDYFLISERLADDMCDHVIRSEVLGSDHCPIVLLMAL